MGRGADRFKKKQENFDDEGVVSPPVTTQVEVCRSFSGIKIPQFDGNNFGSWKMRIIAVLEEHDLDDVILSPSDVADRKREKRCRVLLKLHLADNILSLMDGKSSIEIWKSLYSIYERSGAQLRVHRWHKLCGLRFNERKESLGSFITHFETCAQQLKATGVKLEEIDVVSLFLYSLPNCYDSIVDALQTLSEDKMTIELVKNWLLNFELKRTDKAKFETVVEDGLAKAFLAKPSSHGNGESAVECKKCGRTNHQTSNCCQNEYRCFKCNQVGHICADCRAKSPDSRGQGQNSNGNSEAGSSKNSGEQANQVELDCSKPQTVSFLAEVPDAVNAEMKPSAGWVLDTLAEQHIINDRRWFSKSRKVKNLVRIKAGISGQYVWSKEVGNVCVKCNVNNRIVDYELKNIVFVPKFDHNVVSASLIAEDGGQISLQKTMCSVNVNGKLVMCGDVTSGRCALNLSVDDTLFC